MYIYIYASYIGSYYVYPIYRYAVEESMDVHVECQMFRTSEIPPQTYVP